MEKKKTASQIYPDLSSASPQLKVRTNLRGGESVEACMNNLKSWQDEYYKWYNQAKQVKPLPTC